MLVGFGALFLRLNSIAFGEPRGPSAQGEGLLSCRCMPISRWCSSPASICRRRWSPGSRTSRSCSDRLHGDNARHDCSGPAGSTAHRPWPRVVVTTRHWRGDRARARRRPRDAARPLGRAARRAHGAARRSRPRSRSSPSSAPTGSFRRSARVHPPAIRLERAIRDLYGLRAARALRTRGRGSISASGTCSIRSGRPRSAPTDAPPYPFLPVEGENLHQIPVGPVHAGIIEPGHFRFTANGETVVRLEQRLGYVHKGIESLMTGAIARARRRGSPGAPPATARSPMRWPSRAPSKPRLEIEAPPRAHYLRALMAELERLANHFGDIGAICNDASFSIMHAQCGILRERTLRAADACFGHRLMMDRVVPGGVAADLAEGGIDRAALAARQRAATLPGTDRALRQHRLAAGSHRHHRHPASRRWRSNSAPAAMSAAPPAAPSMCAARSPIRPTTQLHVRRAGVRTKATSMRASGCASARSSRAWP